MTAEPIWARIARVAWGELGPEQFRLMLMDKALSWLAPASFPRVRTAIYRARGVRIGKGSAIIAGITLAGSGDIVSRFAIGRHSVVNGPLHLDLNAPITIGDHVHIGHHVVMITTDHEIQGSNRRCGHHAPKPIVIEDGAWLGARATIGPGVRIGRGSVVAMGSVVMSDVPPNKLVGGNPARPIRTLEE
jgi:maltose O-acetyltransferase